MNVRCLIDVSGRHATHADDGELDLIAGFKLPVGGGTLDVGATWYMYPGGFDNTDFIEPYVKLSGTAGPVNLTAGVAYAPKQEALGAWYSNGTSAANGVYDNPGATGDNLYVWGEYMATNHAKLNCNWHQRTDTKTITQRHGNNTIHHSLGVAPGRPL